MAESRKRKVEEDTDSEKKQKTELSKCCQGTESTSQNGVGKSGSGTYPKLIKFHEKKSELKDQEVVDHEKWIDARRALLEEEKNLIHHMDRVTQLRQQLPWEKVKEDYVFDSSNGPVTLSSLFKPQEGFRDLVIYHMMFGEKDDKPCSVCSNWIEGFAPHLPQLAHHRKVAFAAVGKAPIEKILTAAKEKGWTVPLLSSGKNSFNVDYGVSPPPEEVENKTTKFYNYGAGCPMFCPEYPGMSVFFLGLDNQVYHTYSAYSRGIDLLNSGNMLLDTLPHGRNGYVPIAPLK